MVVALVSGGLAAVWGVLTEFDFAPSLQAMLPDLPAWAIVLLASFIGGALRTITTTPVFSREDAAR